MKKLASILTLILLFSFTISCSQNQSQNQNQNQKQPLIGGVESSISEDGDIQKVKVTADTANIRTGCSANTPVLQTTNKNQSFDVVSKVQDWFAVKLPDNQIGFIPQGQCKPIVVDDNRPEITPSTAGGTTQAPSQANPTPGTQLNAGTTPQSGGVPKTPTTQANSASLTSMEKQMVDLVNQARAQNNLPPLEVDMQVTNVARVKAQDMIDNNYFSHNSPKYGSPFDMMKSFGIHFVKAGENIAGNQTVQAAHNALMNSPGHRENILSPDYTHIGIGIKQGGQYGNMFTQMFVSKPK